MGHVLKSDWTKTNPPDSWIAYIAFILQTGQEVWRIALIVLQRSHTAAGELVWHPTNHVPTRMTDESGQARRRHTEGAGVRK